MKKNNLEYIYVTWHYTTHGIAYLKHVLSAFYNGLVHVSDSPIHRSGISQIEMNEVFGTPLEKPGFVFDKVYYLCAENNVLEQISSIRYSRTVNIEQEPVFKETNTLDIWKEAFRTGRSLLDEVEFFKNEYPDKWELLEEQFWRCIHHYRIEDQLHWFSQFSNAREIYPAQSPLLDKNDPNQPTNPRFVVRQFSNKEISNLRDYHSIALNIRGYMQELQKKHPNAQFIINNVLGTNETQMIWLLMGEAELLPPNTRFIKTYDRKDDPEPRFKRFTIEEHPTKIFGQLLGEMKIYDNIKSKSRQLANIKMKTYVKQGFSILLLGERGTGKTRLVQENKLYKRFAEANCASFDDDSKAESELFGYEKGAFTGAAKDKEGLFQQAHGGMLFLDEIHHLSKRVQAKLLTALQTDQNNQFSIRRLGATIAKPITCTVIFASNKSIEELRELLYPDFFDRITQLIIEFPPLRDTPEDREEDWKNIWEQLKFGAKESAPADFELMNWLKLQKLYGNYRDLQKIAIYYHTFEKFSSQDKALLGFDNAFDYTKHEFDKYYSKPKNIEIAQENKYFDLDKNPNAVIKEFKKDLANWLIQTHGSITDAVKALEKNGEPITDRTLRNWKNGI